MRVDLALEVVAEVRPISAKQIHVLQTRHIHDTLAQCAAAVAEELTVLELTAADCEFVIHWFSFDIHGCAKFEFTHALYTYQTLFVGLVLHSSLPMLL